MTAVVFPEGHIQHPMQRVLNAPMAPYRLGQAPHVLPEGGDVVAHFGGDLVTHVTFAFHPRDPLEILPLLRLGQGREVGHQLITSHLDPAMGLAPSPSARSKERRSVLPSSPTPSPLATSTTACIHRAKPPCRALGERLIRTIRMQSCEGTPLANGKYFRSQLSFSCPKVSMTYQPSATLIIA